MQSFLIRLAVGIILLSLFLALIPNGQLPIAIDLAFSSLGKGLVYLDFIIPASVLITIMSLVFTIESFLLGLKVWIIIRDGLFKL